MSVELGNINTHRFNVEGRPLKGAQLALIVLARAMIAAYRYCQPLLAEMSRSLHLAPP